MRQQRSLYKHVGSWSRPQGGGWFFGGERQMTGLKSAGNSAGAAGHDQEPRERGSIQSTERTFAIPDEVARSRGGVAVFAA
jgi:hypothetical protein